MTAPPRTYLDPAARPLPFCPGCSHATLFDRLERALCDLDLDPLRTVVVSDIGCIGIGDRHFTTHTFHGLHGRSITYATGLKLARPELTVIVLVGDGGIGIGGHHFLNAARRNVDLTVLIANNFNFGMTGGQHSVTTPPCGRTVTTPRGGCERPLDLCGLVAAAGGAFAARALIFDPDLPGLLGRALRTRGFAAVDVWEVCTAHYGKTNALDRARLEAMLQESGWPRGVVVERSVPDFATEYARLAADAACGRSALEPAPVEERFASPLAGRHTLLVAGSAGQKIKSSSALFARAAVSCGLWAVQRDDYPVTVMTGHSLAELVCDRRPIDHLGVEVPDDALLLSADGLRVAGAKLARMPASGRLLTLPAFADVKTPARVQVVDPARLGGLPRTALALALLACHARQSGLVPSAALAESVRRAFQGEALDQGLAAVAAGERAAEPEGV